MPHRTHLAIAGLSLLVATAASAAPAGTVPGTAGFPESVTAAPKSRVIYVSSFATGAVLKGRLGGPLEPFLAAGANGRTSATGMRLDAHGDLLVLTGSGLALQVIDARTGRLKGRLPAADGVASNLNDLAVTKRGDVYVTDFGTPGVYRGTARQIAAHRGKLTRWLSPPASIVPDDPSHLNLNGIAATADGRYLLLSQTATGNLYRVGLHDKKIVRLAVSGSSLTGADGILLSGHTLYVVVHSGAVRKLRLSGAYTSARVTKTLTDPSLDFPTSVEDVAGQLVVTNGLKPEGAADYALTRLAG
jgi:Cu-Zn family superoxide dismutase